MNQYHQTNRARAHALAFSPFLTSTLSLTPRPYGKDGEPDDDQIGRSFESLMAKADKADILARTLYDENFQYRAKLREAKETIKELTAKMPVDGTLVLTAAEAADWKAYTELGKVIDITKHLTEGKAAIEGVAKRGREDALAGAAKDMGYNPEVLTKLAEMNKLELVSRTAEVAGQQVKAHYVKAENGQEVELGAYAQQNWPSFIPALKAAAPESGGAPPSGGQPWTGGGAAGGGGAPPSGGVDLAKMTAGILAGRDRGPNVLERSMSGTPAGGQAPRQGHVPGGAGTPPPAGEGGTPP